MDIKIPINHVRRTSIEIPTLEVQELYGLIAAEASNYEYKEDQYTIKLSRSSLELCKQSITDFRDVLKNIGFEPHIVDKIIHVVQCNVDASEEEKITDYAVMSRINSIISNVNTPHAADYAITQVAEEYKETISSKLDAASWGRGLSQSGVDQGFMSVIATAKSSARSSLDKPIGRPSFVGKINQNIQNVVPMEDVIEEHSKDYTAIIQSYQSPISPKPPQIVEDAKPRNSLILRFLGCFQVCA
jgi:hypothetical protein